MRTAPMRSLRPVCCPATPTPRCPRRSAAPPAERTRTSAAWPPVPSADPPCPRPSPKVPSRAFARCKPPAAARAAGRRQGRAPCPHGLGRCAAWRRIPASSPPSEDPPWIGTPSAPSRFRDAPTLVCGRKPERAAQCPRRQAASRPFRQRRQYRHGHSPCPPCRQAAVRPFRRMAAGLVAEGQCAKAYRCCGRAGRRRRARPAGGAGCRGQGPRSGRPAAGGAGRPPCAYARTGACGQGRASGGRFPLTPPRPAVLGAVAGPCRLA